MKARELAGLSVKRHESLSFDAMAVGRLLFRRPQSNLVALMLKPRSARRSKTRCVTPATSAALP
jgi:hypothetical protein